MTVRVAAICATSIAVLAGCGSDAGKPQPKVPNPPFTARVEITKDGYRPRHVKILVGGRVTFVNVDRSAVHTAETDDLPEGGSDSNEFDTHTLTWGEPYTVTFHKPGKIEYHSSFDSARTGTVEVVTRQ